MLLRRYVKMRLVRFPLLLKNQPIAKALDDVENFFLQLLRSTQKITRKLLPKHFE